MVIKLRRTSAFTDQESDAFMVELIEKTVRKSSHPAVSHNPSNRLPAPIGVQAAPRSTSRGGGSGNSSACLTHHGWGLGEAQRESPLTEARRRKSGGGADLRPCVELAPPRVKQGLQGRGVARVAGRQRVEPGGVAGRSLNPKTIIHTTISDSSV